MGLNPGKDLQSAPEVKCIITWASKTFWKLCLAFIF